MAEVMKFKRYRTRNPWELLVLGGFFGIGALIWLLQKETAIVPHFANDVLGMNPRTEYEVVTPEFARVYGYTALLIALMFFGLYVKLRFRFVKKLVSFMTGQHANSSNKTHSRYRRGAR